MPKVEFMRFFLLIICINFIGCAHNSDEAPSEAELIEYFNQNQSGLEKLKEMIAIDSREHDYFEIRDGRIGKYELTEKGWSKSYGQYVPFSVVSGTYLLTSSRYDEYIQLFKTTKTTAVEYYTGNVSITIFSAGFVFGGCSSEIIFHPEKLNLSRPSWATTYHQVYFNDNWGGITQCN
ncbi:hypothetical protein FJ444_16445 [Aestuariibacter sp. GS-14]|uniref:hypothetical protein n=1 Tax=Aestuariibacter sp. GS-14 TaxID=2590670 RepID=UPI00112C2A8B|nr:hypothetical protein [Aestuariibacter sp. GS-14]TPV55709.1 hypothetical protein FJ444_16445 [Aestuariibacter sp. GS-14]